MHHGYYNKETGEFTMFEGAPPRVDPHPVRTFIWKLIGIIFFAFGAFIFLLEAFPYLGTLIEQAISNNT